MARQVRNAADAGDGDAETGTLRHRLAANADDLDARILLARRYAKRGFPDLALEHYRFAANHFPESVAAALGLAKMLRQSDEGAEALKTVQAFLDKNPAAGWELRSLEGILEDEQGMFERGEASHRAALARDPARGALHNNLGYNLLLQGKHRAATEEFQRALEADPGSRVARNNLGAALAAEPSRAPEEALSTLRHASDPAVAHNNVAAVLMEQGRYAEANTELQTALRFRPGFAPAVANLRMLADDEGRLVLVPSGAKPRGFWQRMGSAWSKVIRSPQSNKSVQQPAASETRSKEAVASPARHFGDSPSPSDERK